MYRPGQLSGRASVLSGELQAGGNSVSFSYDAPVDHPDMSSLDEPYSVGCSDFDFFSHFEV
jgi:hypothetical protein